MNQGHSRGFTVVELLAAIAIVGLLLAILLPVVNVARGAARRATCRSHLHQVGLALLHYAVVHQAFPPAVIWSPPGEPLGGGFLPIGVIDRVARYGEIDTDEINANWLVLILPHLEQASAAALGDTRFPVSHPQNAAMRATPISVLQCPEDSWNHPANLYLRGVDAGLTSNRYARGNFAINLGADANCIEGMLTADGEPCKQGFHVDTVDLLRRNARVWGSGIAGVNRSFGLHAMTDGASHTVALLEIRAGLNSADPRGPWALGQIGASIVARHGLFTDLGGPNPSGSDAIIGCWSIKFQLGEAFPEARGMPCRKELRGEESNLKAAARSLHPGGVHMLLCDGSAHWIANEIDPAVWHALQTRDGSEPNDWQP